MNKPVKFYSEKEERLNIYSHAFGMVLSIIGTVFLVIKSSASGNFVAIATSLAFGMSLILLYAASTFYHRERDPVKRTKLRIVDHAAIYVLIAGTYTPFSLLTLQGEIGWIIFIVIWSLAVFGVLLKLFFTGRFTVLSTLIYVGMGWVIIFAINPLIDQLSYEGLFTLFLGGAFYTIGAILYSIKKLPYNHAIFHIFVLLGSFSHYVSIYYFVL